MSFILHRISYHSVAIHLIGENLYLAANVTRLGDFLHFGQIFKAGGNKYFTELPTLLGRFCRCVKIIHFSIAIIFGQLL